MWMRTFWNNHIDIIWYTRLWYHQIRGQTAWMFHLKTDNLQDIHFSNTKTRPSVSIHSMHFVFPFCTQDVCSIIIPISKKTWEIEATLFSDFSSFLPLRVSSTKDIYSKKQHNFILRDFYNTKFTLGNVISRPKSLIDRGFAEFIFPNATIIDQFDKTCFCCKLNLTTSYDSSLGITEYLNTFKEDHYDYSEFPQLEMNRRYGAIILTTDKDEFTFLSCGDPSYDPPDFLALFIPFTKPTWALIFMTIFGWPLILSLIENDFNLKKFLKDFDALFIVWAMILEQSHLRATNYTGRGPLYCYCGCVLLAILILSNAYKGDNIRAITKSFELVSLTHMEQVIYAGYKKYSTRHCSEFLDSALRCMPSEFHMATPFFRHHFTNKQYKLWEPLDYLVINKTTNFLNDDDDKDQENEHQRRFEWFGECREKKVLVGWRSEDNFVDLEKKLLRKHKNAHISVGKEFIFSKRTGWRLNRYGSIKVLKRMWTLVESGVYNELLNISHKPPIAQASQPRKLAMHGNIFVQFVFLAGGLLLAFLNLIAEFHRIFKRAFCSVRDSVGFLIMNFLQHSQKILRLVFARLKCF